MQANKTSEEGVFEVQTKFVFECSVVVQARNEREAKQIVKDSFGCTAPRYEASNGKILNWSGDIHPAKKCGAVAEKGRY